MNKKGKDSSNEYKWDKKEEMYVPKASPLAYTLFVNERKEEIHKAQEKMTEGKALSVKQIAKKIKAEWNNLEDSEKEKYLAIVTKERKRSELQKKELSEKGFFTLTNGMKSTDIPPPEENAKRKRRSTTPVKSETVKRPMKKNK